MVLLFRPAVSLGGKAETLHGKLALCLHRAQMISRAFAKLQLLRNASCGMAILLHNVKKNALHVCSFIKICDICEVKQLYTSYFSIYGAYGALF